MNRPERKQQSLNSMIGRKQSEESKKKKSLALIGRKRPVDVVERIRLGNLGKKNSPEQNKKLSERMKGKKYRFGMKLTEEQKIKLSKAHTTPEYKKKYGRENNWNWKGGSGKYIRDIRDCASSVKWRTNVFKRDNYECVFCNLLQTKFSKKLNAHHIVRFKKLVEENNIKSFEDAEKCDALWDINNGITLCDVCHNNVHRGERRKKR